ncbi:UDP-N-acetylmuramoyl-L-alanyl-D-glutamate--2,6-diaminopimelate ligase, partial [bacterium]|nr:UDP-N-acetylmuramoyl-L-alanyl-D-glutamate--2,6-diaminopimelate ligase [bacterium]
ERVAGLAFAGVLFTNLSRDHLDYHGDMARYRAAKLRLLALRRASAPALVNADDPAFGPLAGADGVLSYGRAPGADFRIEAEALAATASRFALRWAAGRQDFVSPLIGDFNVSNAAGALALCLALGQPPVLLAERLAAFAGVPGRLQRVVLPGGPAALVDYAHSPDAIARVLAALRPLCPGRLIAVVGAGGDRDRGKRPLMGAAAQAGADLVVLTSDNPRSEDPLAILAEIETGMDRAGKSWHKEPDRARAIRLALALAGPADLVALLGKGHECTQEIAGVFQPFDDAEELGKAWAERSERA